MEPEKQGAWTITSLEQFQFMAKHNELTPTLVNYCDKILNQLIREESAYLNQKERAEEALYEEAIVYGQPVNILIDSEAVGCIISKRFLEKNIRKFVIVQEDWNIYHVMQESEIPNVSNIQLEPEKVVPIRKLEDNQYQLLHQLLDNNKDLFTKSLQKLKQTPEENISSLLKRLIEPSTSPWSFPVVVVKKKNSKLKFCVNYKPLNDIMKKDNYPLSRINEINELLDSLQDAQWFTTLDLASGYWQIKVRVEDQKKTAFITKFGMYEFKVMPFKLCNVYSKTSKDYFQYLEEVLNRIRHIVGKEGVKPDPEKVDKMVNYPEPKNIRELHRVLELFFYYQCFIKDFAKVADPIYKLLKKNAPYEWTNL
ncbi:unnamed protein product [Rhizophagus irregularis]|nr:unnamed protein product [Rhizophagus irregularis]